MTRVSKYTTRTESAVKEALLDMLAEKPLADITVSELARAAHVSRSTFYEHFGNPVDAYEALIDDFAKDVSPLMSQVACSDALRPVGRPFCALVRDAGPLAPAVRESRFLETFLALRDAVAAEPTRDDAEEPVERRLKGMGAEQHDLFVLLVEAGYTEAQAQAVCSFQLSGCFAAARSTEVDDEEWTSVRAVIDRFILGGIAACLAAKR